MLPYSILVLREGKKKGRGYARKYMAIRSEPSPQKVHRFHFIIFPLRFYPLVLDTKRHAGSCSVANQLNGGIDYVCDTR